MSIVGLFTQSRPVIGGLYFDAVIEESSELMTDVTQFPIESGAVGNDHAVQRPLTLIMRVGVSDNPFRALRADAADSSGAVLGSAIGGMTGQVLSALSPGFAVAAGLAASIANAAYAAGQAKVRSQAVLDQIRTIQRANAIINVVSAKREYRSMMITATRQQTTKQNEQGLELEVELTQLLTVQSPLIQDPVPAPNDPVETQAQQEADLGLVVPQ